MKKSMCSKLSLMTLAGSVLVASCTSLVEEPATLQQGTDTELLASPASNIDPNARKSVEVAYFERFTNQLAQLDENGDYTLNLPAYFPGTGVGNSSHMGKAYTFINQYASFGPSGLGSVGAPVTQFFGSKLAEMGIFVDNIEVSSITTDGKGNSIWFKNIQNTVSQSSPERSDFVADVEIVGGTGKFAGASGTAIVHGYFNPLNGQGMSKMNGKIVY